MITINEIAKKLATGDLAVFIGAGVSKRYKEAAGVPSAGEMIELFAKKFPYIENDDDYKNGRLRFEVACQQIRQKSGEKELVEFLCKEMNKPGIRPLPSHRLLAKLPFNSYFTTNFDRLLEMAFSDYGDIYHVIIEDKDVAFWKNNKKPIVKLHGCISKRESIVAAIEDYKPFKHTKPLIDALAKTILASKTILFVGFALQDEDFVELFDELQELLGDYMGRHMAVVLEPTNEDILNWQSKGIVLENKDLTDFLNELALKLSSLSKILIHADLPDSPYLRKLHDITNCPTETTATNVFLEMLANEINSDWPLRTIIEDFQIAAQAVFEEKPNFLAFKNECDEIVTELRKCSDRMSMMQFLKNKKLERISVANSINQHAKWIKASSQILLYSQSVRVIEFLQSVPKQIQQNCTLYISECRTKSPESFYDAKQIFEKLQGTAYKKFLITDSSITYLMAKNQIQSVLMGAHAVYLDAGKMVKFVNTSGSDMIVREAAHFNVPFFVIAEKNKTKDWEDNLEKEIRYDERPFITHELENSSDYHTIEIAYDLCDRTPNMRFISEDGFDA